MIRTKKSKTLWGMSEFRFTRDQMLKLIQICLCNEKDSSALDVAISERIWPNAETTHDAVFILQMIDRVRETQKQNPTLKDAVADSQNLLEAFWKPLKVSVHNVKKARTVWVKQQAT